MKGAGIYFIIHNTDPTDEPTKDFWMWFAWNENFKENELLYAPKNWHHFSSSNIVSAHIRD